MAMPKSLATNLKGSSKQRSQVVSEYAGKASPVSKQARNGASKRYKKASKKNG